MDGFTWLVVFLMFGVPVVAGVLYTLQSNSLQRKFAELGQLKGLTKNRIIAAVGEPHVRAMVDRNRSALTWTVPGYTITLLFEGRMCEGVASEVVSQIRTA